MSPAESTVRRRMRPGLGVAATTAAVLPPWLPIPALVGVAVLSVALWQGLLARERHHIQRLVEVEAGEIGRDVEQAMAQQVRALERMAARWVQRGGIPRGEWTADAVRYVADEPGYEAIEWVDPSLVVRWVAPSEGNEAESGLDLGLERCCRAALEAARDERRAKVTPPVNLADGRRGFRICVPLVAADHFDGFIVAAVRIDRLLAAVLGRPLEEGFAVTVLDGTELLYGEPGDAATRWGAEASIDLGGRDAARAGGQLKALTITLEQRVAERTRQLELRAQELTEANVALERFNRCAVGRELRMIDLKRQVNELVQAAGEPPRYDLSFAGAAPEGGAGDAAA